MKIYLDGVEYKAYRSILKNVGVLYGSLNYAYILLRTPRFEIKECNFLEELLITPGNLGPVYVKSYINFLRTNAKHIKVALELFTSNRIMLDEDCDVEIIPWLTNLSLAPRVLVQDLKEPFVKNKLFEFNRKGTKVHGINCELPFFDSMNSGTWMHGTAGIISYFSKKNRIEICPPSFNRTTVARKLVVEGYDLDLNLIKRGEWKELAKMNCIAWKKYQDHMEGK